MTLLFNVVLAFFFSLSVDGRQTPLDGQRVDIPVPALLPRYAVRSRPSHPASTILSEMLDIQIEVDNAVPQPQGLVGVDTVEVEWVSAGDNMDVVKTSFRAASRFLVSAEVDLDTSTKGVESKGAASDPGARDAALSHLDSLSDGTKVDYTIWATNGEKLASIAAFGKLRFIVMGGRERPPTRFVVRTSQASKALFTNVSVYTFDGPFLEVQLKRPSLKAIRVPIFHIPSAGTPMKQESEQTEQTRRALQKKIE